MRRNFFRFLIFEFLIFGIVLSILCQINIAFADESERIKDCIRILDEVITSSEEAPLHILKQAKGVVLIPGVKKVGLVLGVTRGKGVIVFKNDQGKWLPPLFISLYGGSIGLQLGAKSSDVVIFLMTDKAIEKFKKSKLKLGADLHVTAGPKGKNIGISTGRLSKVDAYSYVKEKGVFAGAVISGSKLSYDSKAIKKYYGKPFTVADIFKGNIPQNIPEEAQKLLEILRKYTQ